MADTFSPKKRKRVNLMMWAMLMYEMRNEPIGPRTVLSWRFLLEWAFLGGTPDEVPRKRRESEQ